MQLGRVKGGHFMTVVFIKKPNISAVVSANRIALIPVKYNRRSVLNCKPRKAAGADSLRKALPIFALKMRAVAERKQSDTFNKHKFMVFAAVIIALGKPAH